MSDNNLVTSNAENTEVAVGGYAGVTTLGFLRKEMDRVVSTGIISSHRFPQRIYKICEASAQQGQKA